MGPRPSRRDDSHGVPQFNNDMAANPVMTPWRKAALERAIFPASRRPLKDKDRVFGVLSIYADKANAFGSEEQSLLGELAENVSFGIVTLRARSAHDRDGARVTPSPEDGSPRPNGGRDRAERNNVLQIVESAARLMKRPAGRRQVPGNLDQIHSRCGGTAQRR